MSKEANSILRLIAAITLAGALKCTYEEASKKLNTTDKSVSHDECF
jgi:hypothetical protein